MRSWHSAPLQSVLQATPVINQAQADVVGAINEMASGAPPGPRAGGAQQTSVGGGPAPADPYYPQAGDFYESGSDMKTYALYGGAAILGLAIAYKLVKG